MKYLLVWGALSLGLGFSFTNRFHSNADNLIKSKNTSVNVNQISKDLTSSSEVNKLTNTINSKVGIIVVDHGSKRDEANKGLEKVSFAICIRTHKWLD